MLVSMSDEQLDSLLENISSTRGDIYGSDNGGRNISGSSNANGGIGFGMPVDAAIIPET